MAEIVNLRRVKKARAAQDAAEAAAVNRAKHGRTRVEKDAATAEAEQRARLLDGARIDPEDANPPRIS